MGVQERPTYRRRVSDSERGRPGRPSDRTGQVAVEVAAGVGAHKADIETVLHEAGVQVHSLDLIPPSLEDVFISTVRRPQET